ncbi:hypothetical protein ACX8Z7_15210 [Glutamicibacter endophyticus]
MEQHTIGVHLGVLCLPDDIYRQIKSIDAMSEGGEASQQAASAPPPTMMVDDDAR